MTVNIFEFATRNKLLFTSVRGQLTTEQLWDVPLRSRDGFDLDEIAKAADRALKNASEESFVEQKKSPEKNRREIALEVVKHIISVKLSDEAAAKKRAENKAKKDRMLQILAEKQDGALSAMSEEELRKSIAEMDE